MITNIELWKNDRAAGIFCIISLVFFLIKVIGVIICHSNWKSVCKMKCMKWVIRILFVFELAAYFFFVLGGCLHLEDDTSGRFVTYLTSFFAFLLSMGSLDLALKTYHSIDFMRMVTSMEGNVLQDGNYTVSYPAMIKELAEAAHRNEFMKIILRHLDADKLRTKTCMEFADRIQEIIDVLIWIAYIDTKREDFQNVKKELENALEREKEKYSRISNGVQYTLNEHIKLIIYVLNYFEGMERQELEESLIGYLENIKGGMIVNPVSQTIYFDYLGLHYYKKAEALIYQVADLDEMGRNEITADLYKEIYTHDFSEEEKNHIMLLLKRALRAFEDAQKASQNDILWSGYILYNKIRVKIFCKLVDKSINGKKGKAIQEKIRKIADIRQDVAYLYSVPGSYIQIIFEKEKRLVLNMYDQFGSFLRYLDREEKGGHR